MRLLLTLPTLLFFILSTAQNTTRKKLKLDKKILEVETIADTVHFPPTDSISLYGYEKAQTSVKETFFVKNSSSWDISQLHITFTYTDQRGMLLHRHNVDITSEIESGETRFVSIKAWDVNKLWHYIGTQARHNAYSTPYNVSYKIIYAIKKENCD